MAFYREHGANLLTEVIPDQMYDLKITPAQNAALAHLGIRPEPEDEATAMMSILPRKAPTIPFSLGLSVAVEVALSGRRIPWSRFRGVKSVLTPYTASMGDRIAVDATTVDRNTISVLTRSRETLGPFLHESKLRSSLSVLNSALTEF